MKKIENYKPINQTTFWKEKAVKLTAKAKAFVTPLRKVVPQNKRGFMDMMVNLMFLFMVIVLLVALLPALKSILSLAQQSDNLNCAGYCYKGNCNNVLSYNATLAAGGDTSTVGCLAISLYLPYLILAILVGGVAKLLYGKVQTPGY